MILSVSNTLSSIYCRG